jgi:hypothetical protein
MGTTASHLEQQQAQPARGLRRRLAAFISMLLLAISLPSGAVAPVEREYAEAVQTFRAGRTAEAFGRFMEMANRGDVDAARIALFLHSYGAVLFNKQWEADPRDVAYWTMLVRNSGTSARPLPEFQPTVLNPVKPKARTAVAKPRGAAAITHVASD